MVSPAALKALQGGQNDSQLPGDVSADERPALAVDEDAPRLPPPTHNPLRRTARRPLRTHATKHATWTVGSASSDSHEHE